MAHVDSINIHRADGVQATAHSRNVSTWLEIAFGGDEQFRVAVFTDFARAQRVADAINAAWPEPEQGADPVIPWSRPGWYRPAQGATPPGMDGDDVLPCVRLDALNGNPDEAA